jgi:hypothetical protein
MSTVSIMQVPQFMAAFLTNFEPGGCFDLPVLWH